MSIFHILLLLVFILVIAGLPSWGYHSYGWGPSGGLGILLVLLVIWLLAGGRLRG